LAQNAAGIVFAAAASITGAGVAHRKVETMKTLTKHLTFNTKQHREYINITPEVEEALHNSGIAEGMILVSAMHITAGVYVNDAESGLIQDIDDWLEGLAPYGDYRHHRTGETNGDSHLKSLLVHHQVIVPVTDGRLDLGPWQQVYYAEFDGRRPKRVIIKVMGE
jgi:secondary thiamine-phosphate synthase enzyme